VRAISGTGQYGVAAFAVERWLSIRASQLIFKQMLKRAAASDYEDN
jgi:hypothetical protein